MKRMTIPLLLLVWTLALAVLTGQSLLSTSSATAQGPKARQQWQYASLVIDDVAVGIHWQAGKTTLSSSGDVTKPDLSRSAKEVSRKLGGKEESTTLGMLLNLIGEDGWEMVSYAHPSGAQVWMFKRPNQ
jgi:hypothetical protein